MSEKIQPQGVHLVGSAPVEDAADMFRICTRHLAGHLKRLPDGEVGERDTWIRWQYPRMLASPQLISGQTKAEYVPWNFLEIGPDVGADEEITFPDIGYAAAAIESWKIFAAMQDAGEIPEHWRFQVGLPTPLSVVTFYVLPRDRDHIEESYRREMLAQIDRMLEVIPSEKLAIQWETVSEFALLEGVSKNHLKGDPVAQIVTRLVKLGEQLPAEVEVGYHLCYGDAGHQHFCQPKDTGFLKEIADAVLKGTSRPVGWIHMPVPRDRDDDAYFLPLADLDLPPETDLYLGLVHQTGGAEGTRKRIATAANIVPRFGLATECGLGRRSRTSIDALLDQHASLARPHTAAPGK